MKHSSSILLAALLTGPSAFASLNFDLRTDYRSVNYNDDAFGAASTNRSFSTFNVKTGRLDYQGKLSDDISFRARIAFSKDATVATSTSNDANLQKAVEFAYMNNKLTDSLVLTIGRYASDIGAFEGITTSADQYMTSAGYSGAGAAGALTGTATNVSATSPYLYLTGVKLAYKMDEHEVSVMAANPVVIVAAQSRLMSGLVYKGAFLDKALNFVASYHTLGVPTATLAKDDNLNFIGVGVTYLIADNLIGVDSLMNTYKRSNLPDTRTENSATINVTYAYKGFETLTPMLKYSQTTETPDSANTPANKTVVTGTSAALEFRPNKDQMVRYHVAYSNLSDKVDGTSITPGQTEFLVGMRITADFLK